MLANEPVTAADLSAKNAPMPPPKRPSQSAPPAKAHRESFHTWGSMLLMVLFYGLTIWLDMFIGIAVVMFLMCLLWGERRIHVAAASALITPLAIFVLFDKVLQVRFPRGIITNWYYG